MMQYVISEDDIEFLKRWREIGVDDYDDRINSLNKKPVTEIASVKKWSNPRVLKKIVPDLKFADMDKYEGKNITIYVEVNDAQR